MDNLNQCVPFVVECNSNGRFFEIIAAFNVDSIAKLYAVDCAKVNPKFVYRVRMILN